MPKLLRTFRRYWKLYAVSCFSLSVALALGVLALSVSNSALLLPPSGADPDRLVMIYSQARHDEDIDGVSYPDYQYLLEHNHVFSDIAAAPNSIGLNVDNNFNGHEVKVVTRPFSENYFRVLGVRPYLGRFFSPANDAASADEGVLSFTCWKRLGADRKIIGKTLAGYTIVGVTPPDFTGGFYGANGDLFAGYRHDRNRDWLNQRETRSLMLLARLNPGVTRAQAQVEVSGLFGQLASAYPKEDKDRNAFVTRATLLPPNAIPTLLIITGILMLLVVLVLLIACANVANLMLAAATGRRQEAAIKLAIGAPRGRLVREFLFESAILCAISGALGYTMAALAASRLANFSFVFPIWGVFSFSIDLRFNGAVIAFTLVVIAIATLATGLAPALYASSPALAQVLGGEIVVGGSRRNIRRNVLVIVQVAICTLVLVGTGLLQRDLYNLRHGDYGFSARNLIAINLFLEAEGYNEATAKAFLDKARRTVAAIPGVQSVTVCWDLPFFDGSSPLNIRIPGVKRDSVPHTVVDSAYFQTFGIPIVNGRAFNDSDREKGAGAAIISRKMAELFWPGKNPLGETILAGEPLRPVAIVGVAADSKHDDIDEPPVPFVYLPVSQNYRNGVQLIARSTRDPALWADSLRKAMRELGIKVPVQPVTLAQWVDLDLFGVRVAAWIIGGLSSLGLALAMIGLLGAVSYSVGERKKELGIRVALGARSGQLMSMILRQTAVVAAIGITVGLLLGIVASALLQSEFYRMGALEWSVLVPVGAAMLMVALLMAYLSARPWLRIDPMEAVRHP